MKKSTAFIASIFVVGSAALWGQPFDQGMPEARRHMRTACPAVRKTVKAEASDLSSLKKTSASEVADALGLSDFKASFKRPAPMVEHVYEQAI